MSHVFFTGEKGVGKSHALARALTLLNIRAQGLETRFEAPRDAAQRTLYLRAYASGDRGCPIAHIPGGDRSFALPRFEVIGSMLLRRAHTLSPLIVVDELGYLEGEAREFQKEIARCLDGEVPVLGVLRARGTQWADWIRNRPDVKVLNATPENRDTVPEMAAELLRPHVWRVPSTPWSYQMDVRYQLERRVLCRFGEAATPPLDRHVRIWVSNGRGQLLLIRRHTHLRRGPGLLCAPGGHADEGESMAEAASRELYEETGILKRPEELIPLDEAGGAETRSQTFLTSADVPLSGLSLQPDEAVEARWETPEAIGDLMERGEAIPLPLP